MKFLVMSVRIVLRIVGLILALSGVWIVSPWFTPAPPNPFALNELLASSYWARVVIGILLLFFGYVLLSSASPYRTLRYGPWYWRDWLLRTRK